MTAQDFTNERKLYGMVNGEQQRKHTNSIGPKEEESAKKTERTKKN